jgi:hypothetical protein
LDLRRQFCGLSIQIGQLDVDIAHGLFKIKVSVRIKKALFSKKEKGPFDLYPILPRLRFKGKKKREINKIERE